MQRPEPRLEDKLYQISIEEYSPVFNSMTRAERRSIKGRLLLAEAELRTVKAQNELLQTMIKE